MSAPWTTHLSVWVPVCLSPVPPPTGPPPKKGADRQTDIERERERDRDRQTGTEKEKQTETETETETDRQGQRLRYRKRQRQRQTERQTPGAMNFHIPREKHSPLRTLHWASALTYPTGPGRYTSCVNEGVHEIQILIREVAVSENSSSCPRSSPPCPSRIHPHTPPHTLSSPPPYSQIL